MLKVSLLYYSQVSQAQVREEQEMSETVAAS